MKHWLILWNKRICKFHHLRFLKWLKTSPVFKKDEDKNKANYRPISILTALSKVYERIMYDQLHHAFQSQLSLNVRIFKAPFLLFCSPENIWGPEEISRQKGSGSCSCHIPYLAKHLTQWITLYCWLNLAHIVPLHRPCCWCPLTWRVANREFKFMGYVLVTETLKLVYLRVPFLGPLLFNIFINDLNFFSLYVVNDLWSESSPC